VVRRGDDVDNFLQSFASRFRFFSFFWLRHETSFSFGSTGKQQNTPEVHALITCFGYNQSCFIVNRFFFQNAASSRSSGRRNEEFRQDDATTNAL
jgi:hypothetical protein